MKLFKQPSWIKPELNEPVYWAHLAILSVVVLMILEFWKGGGMLTVYNVLVSIPILAVGDFVAHTALGLN